MIARGEVGRMESGEKERWQAGEEASEEPDVGSL